MRTLIVYASTYGYTAQCAQQLRDQLKDGADIVNIAKEKTADLSCYDTVLIGGSVYVGQMQKSVKEFCEKNLPQLLTKKIGLFIACGFAERYEEFLKAAFPAELLQKAQTTACFGGEIVPEKLNFLHRTITKMVTGAAKKQQGGEQMPQAMPLPQNISAFAQVMNA